MRSRSFAVSALLSGVIAAASCAQGTSNPGQTGGSSSSGSGAGTSSSTSSSGAATGGAGTGGTATGGAGTGGTGTGGGVADAGNDAADAGPPVCVLAPGGGMDPGVKARLLAPLSTQYVSSGLPKLTWALPAGADGGRVELCQMRACTTIAQTFDVMGKSGSPGSVLSPGVWFWRVHAKTGMMVDPNPSATWEMTVPMGGTSQQFGYGTVPDFNGDGLADVAVGVRGENNGNGEVLVYLADGTTGFNPPLTFARPACENGQLGTNVGFSVASAGDVDGDGYPELITGLSIGSGGALVYMGGPNGPTSPPVQLTRSGNTPLGFGAAVTSVGNVEAFGYAGVAIGTDDPSGTAPGAVYVYEGSATGLGSVPNQTITGPSPDDVRFGAALAGGDFLGSGSGDLVVGAPNAVATKAGHVYIFLGSSSGISATPAATLTEPTPGGGFGSAVAVGEFSDDAYTDLLVGAPGENGGKGRVYVYSGNPFPNFIGSLALTIDAPAGATGFGSSVASLGDVNADGFADIAIGAGGGNTAYVYYGTLEGFFSAGMPILPPTVLTAGATDDVVSVAGVGDFDGDGHADVLLGSLTGGACSASSQGAVRVFTGASLSGTPMSALLQTGMAGDCFGQSLARRDRALRKLLTGRWPG